MAVRTFSIEDNNLQLPSIITSRNRLYKDLDLSFTYNGIGDIYKKIDANAVKQSVKNLILTGKGEKPFNPDFGTNIRNMLFELFDVGISYDIDRNIKDAINKYEPRAFVNNIVITEERDKNNLDISITFMIRNTEEEITLTTTISRLR